MAPSECPATPTPFREIMPCSHQVGAPDATCNELIRKPTSPGWLNTSAGSTPPGVPLLVRGYFGAATSNPAAAQALSSELYWLGTVPRPWENTIKGYGPPAKSGRALTFGLADGR